MDPRPWWWAHATKLGCSLRLFLQRVPWVFAGVDEEIITCRQQILQIDYRTTQQQQQQQAVSSTALCERGKHKCSHFFSDCPILTGTFRRKESRKSGGRPMTVTSYTVGLEGRRHLPEIQNFRITARMIDHTHHYIQVKAAPRRFSQTMPESGTAVYTLYRRRHGPAPRNGTYTISPFLPI